MKKNPVWNVFRHEFNSDEVVSMNVFDHGSFRKDVEALLKKRKKISREEFDKSLKSYCMYYFWSKSEYEILISGFLAREGKARKVDIYQQLMLNWGVFRDYVYCL